ncbi:MAG TPA: TetR/AcrR family transcriptional regulator [Bacillales bacterium]|nr:TetR/AcrR family transcriptional regulator [Bacillales bacterium]
MYRIKEDKRSVQSCRLIYEALTDLMRTTEFQEITVQKLTAHAGVGRATFYRYFDGIEDVLRMKCDETFAQLYDYLLSFCRETAPTEETGYFPFLKPYLRFWYIHSTIIEQLMQANLLHVFGEAFVDLANHYPPLLPETENAKIISRHFDYFLAIRKGIAINILTEWIRNGKNLPPDDLADLVIAQFNAEVQLLF